MPVSMHAKYTERSKFRRKDRVIVCAPQLNYETFVSGTFADQLAEYIRGISTCTHMLAKLGAAPEQVVAFEQILSNAVPNILEAERMRTLN